MGCGVVQNPQTSQPNVKKLNQSKQILRFNNTQIINKQQSNSIKNPYLISGCEIKTISKSYQIKELLGKGTYGKVYRCISNQSGLEFALKVVKLNANSKQQAKKHISNLKSQISVLKKLNHPNIVKYYSFDISPDSETVEIVFQLIQSGSLKDIIDRNGPLSEAQASHASKQILQGLDYLHEKSIIHRDLKCANILLTKDGVIKISDFGTAKQVKVKTNQDISKFCASLKGTPYYMAPQILKRSGHHKSADIWSFGCTLIQMLTGKPPWTTLTDNFQQIISYIVSGIIPPLPSNITRQCQYFLQSCLDSVPSQRLNAKELLNHRFIKMGGKNKSSSLVFDKIPAIYQQDKKSQFAKKENTISEKNKKQMASLKQDQENISQPFLNIKSPLTKSVEVSQVYIPQKKHHIKSAKRQSNNELKKVSKTADHLKMTEQNLLHWNDIQQQIVSQKTKNQKKLKYYSGTNNMNTTTMKNHQLRSNTQITEVDEQAQEIISTALAKQQRQQYMEQQNILKKKKQEQRKKWEEELKHQMEFTKKQKSHQSIKRFQ